MKRLLWGDKHCFAIEVVFLDASRETELKLYIRNANILEYERNGETLTTRWNLDELTLWLKSFIDSLSEDPYPVSCGGKFATEKDDCARNFNTDDDDAFDAYYEAIYKWSMRHRWHIASSGAILADVFFQLVSDTIEISWDNRNAEDNVRFPKETGGHYVHKETFIKVVNSFLNAYADHWF